MDKRKIYLDKVIKVMKNDYPIIKNLKDYGFYDQLSNNEMDYVFSGVFGEPVIYRYGGIFDENGNRIYTETSYGYWEKNKYDDRGNIIYFENSYGYWRKREYDENGNLIYFENSDGVWYKYEYDKNGKEIYYESSIGEWRKTKYDDRGNKIYFEDSYGLIRDNR